ncbi:beta strand repeat-containing protein [Planctomicrobium sp. SH661]|uniref:beta strand repeat-containing protein n=1 Tax=Planctomicrobium sp. SH661 TaxID=3448124 RepID=UPI003F5C80E3
MKYASQRWIGAVAVCLGFASPTWADPIIFPDDVPALVADDSEASVSLRAEPEASISISDATGSVRMGKSASASLSAGRVEQAQYVPPQPELSPLAQSQVARPTQPVFTAPFDDSVGFAQTQRVNEVLWRLGRINGDQYGYEGGYTNFNAFAPLFSDGGNAVTFVNPRISVTDYGFAVANIGAGHRRYSPSRDRVYGASFWYDYDDGHATAFNQLGLSIENIGQYYSYRGNISIPVGDRTAVAGFTDGAPDFTENFVSVVRTYTNQNAYQTYDWEFAFPMPVLGAYGFDFGIGAYYLNGQTARDAGGVSARIQGQVTENFWMNGIYTYDRVFESLFSLNFEYTVPTGKPRRWFRRPPVSTYLTQSVQRRYRVAAGESYSTANIRGRDANGNAITIAYIDPDPAATRDLSFARGTIENPFLSTDEYAASDREQYQFIFVRRGTDAQEAANLNSGITLVEYDPNAGTLGPANNPPGSIPYYGQKLIGDVDLSPANLPFYQVFYDGVESVFQLPSETTGGTGDAPVLSNFTGGATEVVTITGNGHEIFGLTINGATSAANATAAIDGIATAAGTTTNGFYIHGNNFQNVVNGIVIDSDTAVLPPLGGLTYNDWGRIVDNNFSGINTTTTLPQAASERAIVINHTDGNLDLLISDNTIDRFQGGLDPTGIVVLADGAGASINNGATTAGRPELGILRNTITATGSGINIAADNGAVFRTRVNNNSITGGTDLSAIPDGDGLIATANGANSFMNLITFNDNVISNNAGNGALLAATNDASLLVGDPTYDPNDPNDIFVPPMLRNTFSGNGESGMYVNADNGDIVIQGIGDQTVANRNVFSDNDEDGLSIDAENSGRFLLGVLTGVPATPYILNPMVNQSFTGNGMNGLSAQAIGADSVVLMAIGSETAGNTFSNNASETTPTTFYAGINLAAIDGGTLNTPVMNNTVTGNLGNGIQMLVDGSGAATTVEQQIFFANTVTGNTLNGISVTTEGAATIGGALDDEILLFQENVVNTNGLDGILVSANDTSVIESVSVENEITLNGGNGIHLEVNDNAQVEFVSMGDLLQDNTLAGIRSDLLGNGDLDIALIGANVLSNDGFGFLLTADDNATYEIVLGETGEVTNIFDGNGDAGIALDVTGSSIGSLEIVNTQVVNTVNGVDPFFDGQGIAVRMREDAILTDVTIGDPTVHNVLVEGNASSGISFNLSGTSITENATVQQTRIQNTIINDNGLHGIDVRLNGPVQFANTTIVGNDITNNVGDGIHTLRVGAGVISNFRVGQGNFNPMIPNPLSNLIQGNGDNGIFLQARNTNSEDTYIIEGNLINNNGAGTAIDPNGRNGIHMRAEADADIHALVQNNYITNNVARGILTTSRTNTPLDSVSVDFDAYNNIIDSNGLEGIQLSGVHDLVRIGSTANTFPDNRITNNGSHGIGGISGGTQTNIDNNLIADNEGGGIVFNLATQNSINIRNNIITQNTGDDGVQLNVVGSLPSSALVQGNTITFNGGDGVEVMTTTNGTFDAIINDNVIEDNAARGVAIFNRGDGATMSAVIANNSIRRNDEEGVYVVNTSDADQNTDVASTEAMETGGALFANPFMNLIIESNEIFDNGFASGFNSTGLVVRVGTTGGGQEYSWNQDGGFASSTYGGIIAEIRDNVLGGNFGNDVYFESFVSTGPPAPTNGTWTYHNADPRDPAEDEFEIINYQADALARMDLIFTGNTMEQLNATTLGAYYDNDEGQFKSRTDLANGGGPLGPTFGGGPFNANLGGATRRRNAQRLGARDVALPEPGTQLPPNVPGSPTNPASDQFLYAGMGASTFRVNSDVNFTNTVTDAYQSFFAFDGDLLDGNPGYTTWPTANGINFGTTIFGELPFGWGALP